MVRKEHLTTKGLLDIVSIKTSLNLGLSENLKIAFPSLSGPCLERVSRTEASVVLKDRPKVEIKAIHPN